MSYYFQTQRRAGAELLSAAYADGARTRSAWWVTEAPSSQVAPGMHDRVCQKGSWG